MIDGGIGNGQRRRGAVAHGNGPGREASMSRGNNWPPRTSGGAGWSRP